MRDLTITITADAGQAKRELKAVEGALGEVTKTGDDASTKLQTSFSKLLAGAGGAAALQEGFQRLTGYVKDSSKAFQESETASVRLVTALTANGTVTPELVSQYRDLASAFQSTTTFSDDLITEMQALLTQVGTVAPEQMRAALTAATDLSAGLGVDLRTATMLVGKAFEGETGTLKRYGIVIDEAALKTGGASAVLDAIQAKFGGQAVAQMETYSGKIERMNNQWNDMQESLGELIADVVSPALEAFQSLPEPVQKVALGLAAVTSVLAPLLAGGQLVALMFGTTLPAMFGVLIPFLGPIGLIAAAVTAVYVIWKNWDKITETVKAVYTAVKTWLVDKFTAIVDSIKGKIDAVTGFFANMYDKVVGNSYVPDMITGIGREFSRLPRVMVDPASSATQAVDSVFATLQGSVMKHVQPAMNTLSTSIGSLFGGGKGGGLLSSLVSTGLTSVFGPGGIAANLMGMGMQKLAGLAWEGVKKIGGFFKDLFGGPSKDELAGRDLVAAFEGNIHKMLTETQRLETGNESWRQTVVVVRDAYLAMGRTNEEALAAVERLWESSRHGASAVEDAMKPIQDVLDQIRRGANAAGQAISDLGSTAHDITWQTGEVPLFHSGGTIPVAHRGLAVDERLIVAQTGEGILNRGAMRRMGGAAGLKAMNEGAGSMSRVAAGGGSGTVILQLDGRTLAEVTLPHLPTAVKHFKLGR